MNRPHARFTPAPDISTEMPGGLMARTSKPPELMADVLQRVLRQIEMRRAAHKLSQGDRRRLLNAARRQTAGHAARSMRGQP
jgi:hypothetical protein